ncbi:MAG: 2-amino-4-hydroxy-6-hydroxymethyldihydropteridine diphosphokinase [Hyphomicrobiales bacterium]|nr:MAG: 2-amino-4-hydroxy-6-hydroxymethyldihydropteridine diphosphokinase [Hyphomicrobiales bacterium]
MSDKCRDGKPILLALGANLPSLWGSPVATFYHVIAELRSLGLHVVDVSKVYKTRAIGPGLQKIYYNAVISARSDLPPARILREAKRLERKAGRRLGRTWGPRCLDIDLIDYKGHTLRSRLRNRAPGRLILPHPHVHQRAFVLVPLRDVAPDWQHPVTHRSVTALLKALSVGERAGVGPGLAFAPPPCDKTR